MVRSYKLFKINRKRLISTLMSSYASSEEGKAFKLKGSQDFASRSNSVFDGLNALEKQHEKWQSETEINSDLVKPDPVAPDIVDGSIADFKKPFVPISRKRKFPREREPDFRKHPSKWTKYSLADTSDVTDKSNTEAAMQFLDEMRKRRADSNSVVEKPDLRPVFHRPKSIVTTNETSFTETEDSNDKPKNPFTSGIFIMPECVVGMKKPKTSKSKPVRGEKGNSNIRLEHLDESFEDENI